MGALGLARRRLDLMPGRWWGGHSQGPKATGKGAPRACRDQVWVLLGRETRPVLGDFKLWGQASTPER